MITTTVLPQQLNICVVHIRRIAIFQMIFGGLSFILGLIAVIWYSHYDYQIGAGVWGGGFVIISGIVGYQSSKKKKQGNLGGTHMAYVVMNVVSLSITLAATILTAATAIDAHYGYPARRSYARVHYDDDIHSGRSRTMIDAGPRPAWVLNIILAITLAAEFVSAMIASAISCGLRCGRTSPNVSNTVGYTVAPTQSTDQQPAALQYQQQHLQQTLMQQHLMLRQQPILLQNLPQQQPQQPQQQPQQQQQQELLQLRNQVQQQQLKIQQMEQHQQELQELRRELRRELQRPQPEQMTPQQANQELCENLPAHPPEYSTLNIPLE